MRKTGLLLMSMALAVVVSGCILGGGENPADGPALGAFQTSGCKLESAQQTRSLIDGNMIEAIAYDTSVTIIHHDAQYQCNAEITWEMTVNGDLLILREVDKSTTVTRCMCPMDLSITIDNLTPGKVYTIQVWDEFETRMFGEVMVDLGDCDAQCVTDEDCWMYPDLPRLDCEGKWACIQGMCNYYCDTVDLDCTSDADCPEGFQCVFYGNGGGAPEVNPDGTMAGQAMIAYECASDSDCPDGMICEIVPCACEPGADCDCWPYGYCTGGTVWPTEGVCEPIVVNNECRTDADCGSGYHCEFFYPMPVEGGAAESDAQMPAEPMPPIEECYCTEEWAPVCGADGVTYSNYCFAKCAWVDVVHEGECQGGQGIGYCVPDQEPGCYSDYDCPAGYYCLMTDWCAGVDYDGDGMIDPTWCVGECVPRVSESCESMGGYCMWMDENQACAEGYEWLLDGMYDGKLLCGEGMGCCAPAQPEECRSDEDCYNMYGDSSDPASGMPIEWACVDGFCQARHECGQMQCYSDADCGDGYACVATGWCDEAGNCCETTVCLPFEEPPYCTSNKECADGEVCVNGMCQYVEPVCQADSDCPEGMTCIDGFCQRVQQDCEKDASGMCVCGGFAGFACPESMVCVFDDPNCSPDAGGADCMGHCYALPDDCVCDMMYAPVCGVDGKTYSNKCMAACAGVRIASEGECPVK